jgi:hypothetical protein
MPLSKEGLEKLEMDNERVISTCKACNKISPGWEMVSLLRERNSRKDRRRHYIVESKTA